MSAQGKLNEPDALQDKPPGCGDLLGGLLLFGLVGTGMFVQTAIVAGYGANVWAVVLYGAGLLAGALLFGRGVYRRQISLHGAAFLAVSGFVVLVGYLLPL